MIGFFRRFVFIGKSDSLHPARQIAAAIMADRFERLTTDQDAFLRNVGFTPEGFARATGYSAEHVRRLIGRGVITARRIGKRGRLYIPLSEYDRLVGGCRGA